MATGAVDTLAPSLELRRLPPAAPTRLPAAKSSARSKGPRFHVSFLASSPAGAGASAARGGFMVRPVLQQATLDSCTFKVGEFEDVPATAAARHALHVEAQVVSTCEPPWAAARLLWVAAKKEPETLCLLSTMPERARRLVASYLPRHHSSSRCGSMFGWRSHRGRGAGGVPVVVKVPPEPGLVELSGARQWATQRLRLSGTMSAKRFRVVWRETGGIVGDVVATDEMTLAESMSKVLTAESGAMGGAGAAVAHPRAKGAGGDLELPEEAKQCCFCGAINELHCFGPRETSTALAATPLPATERTPPAKLGDAVDGDVSPPETKTPQEDCAQDTRDEPVATFYRSCAACVRGDAHGHQHATPGPIWRP